MTSLLSFLVSDHVAGMTDDYALSMYESLFIPAAWGRR